jgi:hypothetical protein
MSTRPSKMRVAKHTKGNAQGIKTEQRNLRIVPRRSFVDIDALLERLFGPLAQTRLEPAGGSASFKRQIMIRANDRRRGEGVA